MLEVNIQQKLENNPSSSCYGFSNDHIERIQCHFRCHWPRNQGRSRVRGRWGSQIAWNWGPSPVSTEYFRKGIWLTFKESISLCHLSAELFFPHLDIPSLKSTTYLAWCWKWDSGHPDETKPIILFPGGQTHRVHVEAETKKELTMDVRFWGIGPEVLQWEQHWYLYTVTFSWINSTAEHHFFWVTSSDVWF